MKFRWHINQTPPRLVQLSRGPESGRRAWYLRVGPLQFDFVF
jgi:hypothetical protein